jgi:hypothetical protein
LARSQLRGIGLFGGCEEAGEGIRGDGEVGNFDRRRGRRWASGRLRFPVLALELLEGNAFGLGLRFGLRRRLRLRLGGWRLWFRRWRDGAIREKGAAGEQEESLRVDLDRGGRAVAFGLPEFRAFPFELFAVLGGRRWRRGCLGGERIVLAGTGGKEADHDHQQQEDPVNEEDLAARPGVEGGHGGRRAEVVQGS